MHLSRSLQELTNQFISSQQIKELSANDKRFITEQFKKIYSQQMSKVTAEVNRRNLVKNNKTDLQNQQERQLKSIQEGLIKKMQEHHKKRQKVFNTKLRNLKLHDQNWRLKMQQIQRKQKQQQNKSLQKSNNYRKEVQTFWSQNNNRQKRQIEDSTLPIIQPQKYYSIKTQIYGMGDHKKDQKFFNSKPKSRSKNQMPRISKIFFRQIQKTSQRIGKIQKKGNLLKQANRQTKGKIPERQVNNMHSQSIYKQHDERSISEHIQKSKSINNQRQQLALEKALSKLKRIQLSRKRCKANLQKALKQSKPKRQILAAAFQSSSKAHIHQTQLQRQSFQNPGTKPIPQNKSNSQPSIIPASISLIQSIDEHRRAKQRLQQKLFQERGQLLQENMQRQKKGRMIRMVRETVDGLRKSLLKDST